MLINSNVADERLTTAHPAKLAYVYVRQSSVNQVRQHQESTELQHWRTSRGTAVPPPVKEKFTLLKGCTFSRVIDWATRVRWSLMWTEALTFVDDDCALFVAAEGRERLLRGRVRGCRWREPAVLGCSWEPAVPGRSPAAGCLSAPGLAVTSRTRLEMPERSSAPEENQTCWDGDTDGVEAEGVVVSGDFWVVGDERSSASALAAWSEGWSSNSATGRMLRSQTPSRPPC